MTNSPRLFIGSALASVVFLAGPTAMPLAAALLSSKLPSLGHSIDSSGAAQAAFALVSISLIFGGGAFWGWTLGKLSGSGHARRLAVAGSLGWGLSTIVVGFALGTLEESIARLVPNLPIHNLFTMLFTPAVFVITGVTGIALGIAMRDRRAGVALGWRAGLVAALAFAAVDLILDSLGVRVGGPNAAESATMLRVLTLGNVGAAIAGGATTGLLFSRHVAKASADVVLPAQTA
ncbi:MAG: hypothetical protein HY260_19325 [Chloroflexi bacterium]|nr:hypothetical protein [Chloroflexota bacterium]